MEYLNSDSITEITKDQIRIFLNKAGFSLGGQPSPAILLDGVLELVDKLKSYQEEGKELRPEFFIFKDSDYDDVKGDLEVKHFFEVVHETQITVDSFATAIKHCAPLAHGPWACFIKLRNNSLAYGLMRRRYSVTEPAALNHEDPTGRTPFIRIRQIEKHVLELRGPTVLGEISFRVGRTATNSQPAFEARSALLNCIAEKAWPSKQVAVRAFFEEVLERSVLHGHGFLIAITESRDEKQKVPLAPDFLKGLTFDPWIIPTQLKIAELMKWQLRGNQVETKEILEILANNDLSNFQKFADEITYRYAEVEAWVGLVASMLMSDGITWLDNRGRVLGYRMFVQIGEKGLSGARSRAFGALKEFIHQGKLRGAYMQSQDGKTEVALSTKETSD